MAPSAVAYRKPWFTAMAVVGVVGSSGAFAGISLAHPNGSDLFGAVILSLFAWFFWLVGWHSAVRMDAAGVVVNNLFVRHAIPWSALEAIQASGGLRFLLRDGTSVGCLMYGGSLAACLARPVTRVSALTYLFQSRTSARAGLSRIQLVTCVGDGRGGRAPTGRR
jgi:hypothetical protein